MSKYKVGDQVIVTCFIDSEHYPGKIVKTEPSLDIKLLISQRTVGIIKSIPTNQHGTYSVRFNGKVDNTFFDKAYEFYEPEMKLVNKYTNTELKSGGNI